MTKKPKAPDEPTATPLFPDLPPSSPPERVRTPKHPLWTEHKARLIERYLFYFVMITRHGTYIDGFAGPQEPSKPDTWAARLVLESSPRWFRHFHLFEKKNTKVAMLQALRATQPDRDINVYEGDCNVRIAEMLASSPIRDKEATFCLIDQRTFECSWATVRALAEHKPKTEHKIELFYFLANKWLDRALGGAKKMGGDRAHAWWGGPGWQQLLGVNLWDRVQQVADRFANELGYKFVKPWPIYSRKGGGSVMYFMIHATDHPRAHDLMARAYNNAVSPPESPKQIAMELGVAPPDDEKAT